MDPNKLSNHSSDSEEEVEKPTQNDNKLRQEPVEQDEGSATTPKKKEDDIPLPPNIYPKPNVKLWKNKQVERERSFIPPKINCPEKIIFCIDLSMEMNQLPFLSPDGVAHSPLSMIRRIIEFFVLSKSRIDDRHEYALVGIQDGAVWLKDFVNDPKDFLEAINDVQDTYVCDTMNFTLLLDLIYEKIPLPVVENHTTPPPYTVRVIFLYTRSFCIPEIEILKESHKELRSSEYFFFDVFYIHMPASDENSCQDIYDFFCKLDERGTYYILEVARNITHLHSHMVKFLAHPLQRLPQGEDSGYSLIAPSNRYPNERAAATS